MLETVGRAETERMRELMISRGRKSSRKFVILKYENLRDILQQLIEETGDLYAREEKKEAQRHTSSPSSQRLVPTSFVPQDPHCPPRLGTMS
jgi:hypothetical protein